MVNDWIMYGDAELEKLGETLVKSGSGFYSTEDRAFLLTNETEVAYPYPAHGRGVYWDSCTSKEAFEFLKQQRDLYQAKFAVLRKGYGPFLSLDEGERGLLAAYLQAKEWHHMSWQDGQTSTEYLIPVDDAHYLLTWEDWHFVPEITVASYFETPLTLEVPEGFQVFEKAPNAFPAVVVTPPSTEIISEYLEAMHTYMTSMGLSAELLELEGAENLRVQRLVL